MGLGRNGAFLPDFFDLFPVPGQKDKFCLPFRDLDHLNCGKYLGRIGGNVFKHDFPAGTDQAGRRGIPEGSIPPSFK